MKAKYVCKRLLIAIPTFFGITLLCYLLALMAPGSPLDAMLEDPFLTVEELERRRVQFGLDQPAIVQYFTWLGQFLQGNLGFSYRTQRAVTSMISECIGPTLLLAGSSFFVALVVALPLGIFAASKPYGSRDYLSSGLAFVLAATPNFFMGLVMIYIFAVKLGILPSNGMYDSSGKQTLPDLLRHLILPTLVLAFQQMGSWIRYMRSSMVEVLQEDYIRTARAKGLGKWAVIMNHGVKNSLIPVVTVIGMSVPTLVSGAVITESIFTWPGIGRLLVAAIQARDYPVIMGITALVAVVVLAFNILVDIVYGFLDPKISYS